MNVRKENIVSANDDTCGWLLENKNYARWVQSDVGLLWIQGKGGAGKSTLMKYIYEKIQMPTDDAPGLRLSFFFHGRGEDLQRTRLGMFKSLLLQLYKGDPISRTKIKKEFDKNSEDGIVDVKWEWSEKKLEGLFSNLICQIAESKKVTIFVDALDEAEEVVANDLAVYLTNLYEKVQQDSGTVKICFSSRHYPIVSAKVADNQKVIVEHENEHGIRFFVHREFEQRLQDDGPIKSKKVSLELESDIAAKANGVFQWVCLVLQIIFKADREAESLGSIKKILNSLPKDLNEMYRYILRGLISQEQQTGALKLFRWVCFAARQLSIEEVRDAMAVDDSLLPPQGYSLKDSSEYVEHGMETRIKALSGGLIEVRGHSSGTVVQVGHQTIRDFLLKEGFEILSRSLPTPQKHSKGLCHNILARLCINYLWTKDIQQLSYWDPLLALNTVPLLQYAIAACFWHASNAEHNGYHQESLSNQFGYRYTRKTFNEDTLEQGVFSIWRRGGTTYCPRDYFGVLPSKGSTLLHIASMANIPTAVKSLLKQGAKVDEKDERGQQAIHYAAREDATEAVGILIKALWRPKFLYSVVNAEDNNSVTPLQLAARNKKDGVMRLLITEGATIKCLIKENSTKIQAVHGDIEKTVSLLFEDAAEFNAQSLYSAALVGNSLAVQVLLAEGADANARGGRYDYALVAAANKGHIDVVQVLLWNGAEIDAQSEKYGSALLVAALHGHDKMISVLLQAGADINAKDRMYGDALTAASYMGNTAIVKMLLEQGAEINAQSEEFGNALAAAALNGYTEVVHTLLERGADINAKGGKCGNALAAAAYNGYTEVIDILLGGDANINAESGKFGIVLATMLLFEGLAETNAMNGEYTSDLELALRAGDIAAVKALLLKAEAKRDPLLKTVFDFVSKRDSIARSMKMTTEDVLLAAAWVGRLDIVDRIIKVNKQGRSSRNSRSERIFRRLSESRLRARGGTEMAQYNGYTPLQLSAAAGNPEVVASLLAAGVEVNAPAIKDGGRTALQAAARWGHLEIVKTLLDAGANVDAITGYDNSSATALHEAAIYSHREIVRMLLAHGASPNITRHSFDARTALLAAAKMGDLEIVTMLLEAGADVNATGFQGATPLHEAQQADHLDVAALLLSAGGKLKWRR
jgi:ankyrin repeat protein